VLANIGALFRQVSTDNLPKEKRKLASKNYPAEHFALTFSVLSLLEEWAPMMTNGGSTPIT